MRLPKYSVAMLMALVGWLAVQIAAMRHFYSPTHFMSLCFLPAMTVFGAGALFVIRDLFLKGETSPFLTGFEIIGGSILCLARQYEAALVIVAAPAWERLLVALMRQTAAQPGERTWLMIELLLLSEIFTIPIFLIALGGGWIAKRIGLTLVIKRRPPATEAATTTAPGEA